MTGSECGTGTFRSIDSERDTTQGTDVTDRGEMEQLRVEFVVDESLEGT